VEYVEISEFTTIHVNRWKKGFSEAVYREKLRFEALIQPFITPFKTEVRRSSSTSAALFTLSEMLFVFPKDK